MEFRSRRWKRIAIVCGLVGVAVISLNAYVLDGILGWFYAAIGAAPTEFAVGNSDQSFRRIKEGMGTEEVKHILGAPLYVAVTYSNGERLGFEGLDGKPYNGIGWSVNQLTRDEAGRTFGDPETEAWVYARSPTTSPYQVRYVRIDAGRVVESSTGYSGSRSDGPSNGGCTRRRPR
jgi:hypothetical protein